MPAACYVHDIGVAVPERSIDCEEGVRLLSQACLSPRGIKLFGRIARLTGIEKRHLAALNHQNDENGGPLYQPATIQFTGPGMSARTRAFDQDAGPLILRAMSAFGPESLAAVQTLITVSCTHASSPGLEQPILMRTLVPPGVDRWNLGFMGCSAALAGMRLVHQTRALRRQSLIVACELSSLHFQYTDQLDQMTANALFADGAAAMLLGPRPSPVRVIACRCAALPGLADQMVWFAGDHGLQLRLAQELPDTLGAHLPGLVSQFLRACELSPSQINHWLAHPGGPQILDVVERSLDLPPDSLRLSRQVFRQFGNMSSPTIFFILKDLIASGATGYAVAMAFGPGLTIEVVLLHLDHRPY